MRPIDAAVPVPGSKSITNRALILAALADGPSRLNDALDARDTRLMIEALRALGVQIEVVPASIAGNVNITVAPAPLHGPAHIDAGLSGTVMRFIAPVAALATGRIEVDGDEQARVRPMKPLLDALRRCGVDIEGDALPYVINGTGKIEGASIVFDASASSQFVSALLLAAPLFGIDVRVHGTLPSRPHVDMTVRMLAEHGVNVETIPRQDRWIIKTASVDEHRAGIPALDRMIEPDLSNATPFLAAAMATSGTVCIPGWPRQSLQAAPAILDVLTQMGASVEVADNVLTLTMTGPLRGIDADLSEIGEIAPTVAALAALADGPSSLHGITHLRGHETDRLAALQTELTAIGARTTVLDDGLRIEPGELRGGVFHTYADHRIATAGAIIGLRTPGIVIDDITCTDKTLPGFADRWQAMLR